MKQLLLIINEDRFFLSHRTRIAQKAMDDGWDVTIVAKDTGRKEEIKRMGLKYINLPVNPTGMNPVEELKTFRFLFNLIRKNPGAIIHLVGLKNMLWGGLASRLAKSRGVLYAVSGLGTLFGENNSGRVAKLIQKVLKFGMHDKNVAVIFQNKDDEELFEKSGILGENHKFFIKGSGVDLNEYNYTPENGSDPIKIIFTARMLKEKGVEDLIAAAEILRSKFETKIEFVLCGDLSSNPNALKESDMNRLTDGKYIKWLGYRTDICDLLKESSIMCFPSYYREGLPKSLIEASAVGRPIVTTDSVGCRDTVKEGENGFIVSPHDPQGIAKALEILIESPELRRRMGENSRKIAESEYDVEKVANVHLDIYNLLNVNGREEKN